MQLKRQKFIDAYLSEANGNATEAARIAGYADPMREGYRIKNAPEVKAEIARLLAENTLAAAEVLSRLSDQARGTLTHFLKITGDEVTIDLSTEGAKANLHLLKKAKTKRRTGGTAEAPWEEVETELELHDPQSALALLARYWKLLTDKVQIENDEGKPFIVKVLRGVRMEDLNEQ